MQKFRRTVCALLFFALIWSLALSVTATGSDDWNYGRGSERDARFSGAELFDLLFSQEMPLSAGERLYLSEREDLSFIYSAAIPDSVVKTVCNPESGVLTVTVPFFTYVAANGEQVTWKPENISLHTDAGMVSPPLTKGENECTAVFHELPNGEEFELEIGFAWAGTVSAESADRLLIAPREAAQEALVVLNRYESALADYQAGKDAYERYLRDKATYQQNLIAYREYLAKMEVYSPKKEAYDAYLAAKADYEARVAAYEEYLIKKAAYDEQLNAYFGYFTYRMEHEALYDAYEQYINELAGATSRLAIMENMFIANSQGWKFYSGLMGSAVDMVLSNREKLISAGVDGNLVKNANAATESLRAILSEYSRLRRASYESDLAKTTTLFSFYATHYDEIRAQISVLFESIRAIYMYPVVQTVISGSYQDRLAHFHHFLSQMYLLKCCLNDAETIDLNWKLTPNAEDLETLIGAELWLQDNNRASPVGVTLPTEEVTLETENGTAPQPVPFPVKDFVDLDDPRDEGQPEPVPDPGAAPKTVPDPGAEPKPVGEPGRPPEPHTLSAGEEALARELRAGTLPERSAKGVAQSFTVRQSVNCRRPINDRRAVTFYLPSGEIESVLYVNAGDRIGNPPQIEREADAQYSYRFLGWSVYGEDGTGELADLREINEDLSLWPLFEKTLRVYTVSWQVAGRTVTESYYYGDTPVCPIDTDRADDENRYTFTGWDQPVKAVTGNATYTACYEETPITYTVTWDLGDRRVEQTVPAGSYPQYEGSTDRAPDAYLYTFTGWDRTVTRVYADVTYTAQYRTEPLLQNRDGSAAPVEHTDSSVTVMLKDPTVAFAKLAAYAKQEGKTLSLRWDNLSVTLTSAEADALMNAFCTSLSLETFRDESFAGGTCFVFRGQNSIGQEQKLTFPMNVTVYPDGSEGVYLTAYRMGANQTLTSLSLGRFSGGKVTLTCTAGERILLQPEYALTYTDESDNCNLSRYPARLPAGSTVDLSTDCAYGYEVSGATLRFADGRTEEVGVSFTMPAERTAVELHVTKIVYHITFIADGATVSEQDLFFGESVALPPDPEKATDEEFYYTFTGWTPYVTRATGENRNPVYTAAFSATPIGEGGEQHLTWGNFFLSGLFLGAVSTFLLLVGLILILIFRKKAFPFIRKLPGRIAALFDRIFRRRKPTPLSIREDAEDLPAEVSAEPAEPENEYESEPESEPEEERSEAPAKEAETDEEQPDEAPSEPDAEQTD